MKWCPIVLLLCCSTASATPPGVKLSVDAEISGVIRETADGFYVERDLTKTESDAKERIGKNKFALEVFEDEITPKRRWLLLDPNKEQLTKLIGKRVEVTGKMPLLITEGAIPSQDKLTFRKEIRVTGIREVK